MLHCTSTNLPAHNLEPEKIERPLRSAQQAIEKKITGVMLRIRNQTNLGSNASR